MPLKSTKLEKAIIITLFFLHFEYKMEAIRLMKYGKPAEAEELLRKALRRYIGEPEPAYYLEMTLVEVLICQVGATKFPI